MKRKLKSGSGFSMVELMVAAVILGMLALLLNVGLNLAASSYQDNIAQAEAEIFLSSAADTLVDDLRYARDVRYDGTGAGGNNFYYNSDSYGENTKLDLSAGRLLAYEWDADSQAFTLTDPKRVLPDAAYGVRQEYVIATGSNIQYVDNVFTITLNVTDNRKVNIGTTVTVRCLNSPTT